MRLQYRNTWHVFHAIMTLVTGGLWSIVWLCCWASNAQYNAKIERIEREALHQQYRAEILAIRRGFQE